MRALVTSLLLLGACGAPGDPSGRAAAVAALTGDVGAGEAVFAARCATCHGAQGAGTSSAPNIKGPVRLQSVTELAAIVLNGSGQMPGLSVLTNQEIADVIAWGKATLK